MFCIGAIIGECRQKYLGWENREKILRKVIEPKSGNEAGHVCKENRLETMHDATLVDKTFS